MHHDIENVCKHRVKTAFVQLNDIDDTAHYSEPVMIVPGQFKISVKLPKFGDATFDGVAGSIPAAKWAAAKAAVTVLQEPTESVYSSNDKKYDSN